MTKEKVAATACNGCKSENHAACADWPGKLRCPCPCVKDESHPGPKSQWAKQILRKVCEPCQMGFHAECATGGTCACPVMNQAHAERAFALKGRDA